MIELGSITLVEEPVLTAVAADERGEQPALSTADLAECNCPEFCERDHDID